VISFEQLKTVLRLVPMVRWYSAYRIMNQMKNLNSVVSFSKHTLLWKPGSKLHLKSTNAAMHAEIMDLQRCDSHCKFNGYSEIAFKGYTQDQGGTYGFFNILLRDNMGRWHSMRQMLMLDLTIGSFYLTEPETQLASTRQARMVEA